MDNEQFRPGTFNVQTAPQVVTIAVDPAALAALQGIQTSLGLILAEIQAAGATLRESHSASVQMDAFNERVAAALLDAAPRRDAQVRLQGPTMPQDGMSGQDMAQYVKTVSGDATGAENASVDPAYEAQMRDVAGMFLENATPDAIYEGMTLAQVYKAIESTWVFNESGQPVIRGEDRKLRAPSPMERQALNQQLAKGKKRK